MDRLHTTRSHLGYLLQLWFRRRPKTQPNPADISSVRVALVMAVGCGEAMEQAADTAIADMRAAGISLSTRSSDPHASVVSTLTVAAAAAKTIGQCADREMKRLGMR